MRILFIDLSRKTWRVETADTSLEKGFIGGRGVNQRLLWDLTDPAQGVLSPESPIILGSGPFVGTLVPAASRRAVPLLLRC
ncbi:MAG: aldehyde ferredoxin oxidoreductase N-terminal domain-containing protein [Synergistota bacterium]|nr:aldehyde ferredoxin oxidoreductase N-terminal domain-containing protein [Synergistota bacterium]